MSDYRIVSEWDSFFSFLVLKDTQTRVSLLAVNKLLTIVEKPQIAVGRHFPSGSSYFHHRQDWDIVLFFLFHKHSWRRSLNHLYVAVCPTVCRAADGGAGGSAGVGEGPHQEQEEVPGDGGLGPGCP